MPGGKVNGELLQARLISTGAGTMWFPASRPNLRSPIFFALCLLPDMSTIAVRDPAGYFDPFRGAHYEDPEIQKAYTPEFLAAHKASMVNSIPDLYLKGQGEYFDELAGQHRGCRCRHKDA